MMLTRAFDARMLLSQRQGKMTFYTTSAGEEAIATAQRWRSGRATWAFRPTVSRACSSRAGCPWSTHERPIFSDRMDR